MQRCNAAVTNMTNLGWWRGVTQQFNPGTNQWANARGGANNDDMECALDSGVHGQVALSLSRWARNNATKWTATAASSINWGGRQSLSLYSSNYANWWYGTDPGSYATRWEIVRDVAKNLIDNLDGVNLGIMRYSSDGNGGMVVYPVSELTAVNRTAMKALLDGYAPGGVTPLSETFYEAALYFRGGAVDFGNTSVPVLSIAGARTPAIPTGANYDTPMDFSCQHNYIVYLTDGLPVSDEAANAKIPALPGFAAGNDDNASCDTAGPYAGSPTQGQCMVNLARYLHDTDLQAGLVGTQNVKTFMIGFGSDIADSKDYLDRIAAAGGTVDAYTSDSVGGLTAQLEEIFSTIIEGTDVTFTSPTLSVNAFNRTRNLSDLYVSVFSPARGLHWPGNLKKYRVEGGEIVDAAGDPAVDPDTGFFRDGTRSFWSKDHGGNDVDDGAEVTVGGASSRLPSYVESVTGRKLYTYLGAENELDHSSNAISIDNDDLSDAVLDLVDSDDPARPDLIAFVRGQDLLDADNLLATDRRMRMGDPMHARPSLVIYGGTAEEPEGVVYVPTNDGYLHAIDSQTGIELWSFIPPEFLPRLKKLYEDAVTPEREYALDGDVTVWKYDIDGDGIVDVDDGDKVYMFFGFGRGGGVYYALNVTNKEDPLLLWKRDATQLPGLAKAWSTPTIAKVDINGATQSTGKFVLIFGGGYDEAQENYVYTTDTTGNRIFMVDLASGNLLWDAGLTGSGADLELDEMNNSIPSRVTVIDIDGNKFADRMYVGDMGGRVWRFDIWNGQGVDALVTGGVLARLGAGSIAGAPRSAARRFYNAPDVAIIQRRGSNPFFNIAIGSGYRGHPLESDTQDRFYSLRDHLPFTKRTQAQYEAITPTVDGDLVDVTNDVNATLSESSPGWKLLLNDSGSWIGEKVLAESVTVAGAILFPTFIPLGEDPANPCLARTVNRAYAVRVENGRPFFNFNDGDTDGDGDVDVPADAGYTTGDRYSELRQTGIAAEISILINEQIDDTEGTTCLSGVEVMERCVDFGSTVRSFWRRQ